MDLSGGQPGAAPLVLVTGASGFIGRVLVEQFLAEGARVRVLVRPGTVRGLLPRAEGVEAVEIGGYDDPVLRRAMGGVEQVYHLGAALSAPDWAAFHRANVDATRLLLEASVSDGDSLKRWVHVSSISAMGPSPPGLPLDEEAPLRPVSLYGRSKAEAEEVVSRFMGRLPLVVVRPPNVLGYGQRELMTVLGLLSHRVLPAIGNGRPQTSLCFVEDLCRALRLCGQDPRAVGGTYLVTDGHAYSWRQILLAFARALGAGRFRLTLPYPILWSVATAAEQLFALAGRPSPLSRADLVSSRRQYWLFDGGRIRRQLGFSTRQDFASEVEAIARRYQGRGKAPCL